MGLFDSLNDVKTKVSQTLEEKGVSEKIAGAKEQLNNKITEKGLDEKFENMKSSVNESMTKFKESNAENNARRKEAKAPIEGAIIRYYVLALGGFPNKSVKNSDSKGVGLNVMEDSFIFKPEIYTQRDWFGPDNYVILYENVKKVEIVERQLSSFEYIGSSDAKALEQKNNIEITHYDDEGRELVTRVEMLDSMSVMTQAKQCREFMDLLREKNILNKFGRSESNGKQNQDVDIVGQIEKLAKLKEAGVLSEDEFNTKKAELLSRL